MSNSVTAAESDASRTAVFAAGHLGELTWQIPFELVDAVLAETKTVQRRLRDLPSRVGVYFVLALCLFPALGYREGVGEAHRHDSRAKSPSEKALWDLRRRLGAAPLQALFEVLAGPVAQPGTPGVRFGRYRTVAFDGCVSFKVADTDRNRSWLGKLKASLGVTGYPVMRLMTLVETGTRALLGAVFGPPGIGETDYARKLLALLGPDMLVLADRGFDAEGVPRRPGRHRRAVPGPAAHHPPAARAGAARRRLAPVPDRRADRADHHRRPHRHLRRRHPLHGELSAGHHPAGPAPPSRPRADRALPRTLGTRDRLPGAAAHPRRRPRAAFDRPGRTRTGNVGAADRLPSTAAGHGHRSRIPAPAPTPTAPASPPRSKPRKISWSTPST